MSVKIKVGNMRITTIQRKNVRGKEQVLQWQWRRTTGVSEPWWLFICNMLNETAILFLSGKAGKVRRPLGKLTREIWIALILLSETEIKPTRQILIVTMSHVSIWVTPWHASGNTAKSNSGFVVGDGGYGILSLIYITSNQNKDYYQKPRLQDA